MATINDLDTGLLALVMTSGDLDVQDRARASEASRHLCNAARLVPIQRRSMRLLPTVPVAAWLRTHSVIGFKLDAGRANNVEYPSRDSVLEVLEALKTNSAGTLEDLDMQVPHTCFAPSPPLVDLAALRRLNTLTIQFFDVDAGVLPVIPWLKSLTIGCGKDCAQDLIGDVFTNFEGLRHLSFNRYPQNNSAVESSREPAVLLLEPEDVACTGLQSLQLAGVVGGKALTALTALRNLELDICASPSDYVASNRGAVDALMNAYLPDLPWLESLKLRAHEMYANDPYDHVFTRFKGLRRLWLNDGLYAYAGEIGLHPSQVKCIGVDTLYLGNIKAGGILRALPKLATLEMKLYRDDLGAPGVLQAYLPDLPDLRSLAVVGGNNSGQPLADHVFSRFAGLTSLRLNVWATMYDIDPAFACVSQSPSEVRCKKLEELMMDGIAPGSLLASLWSLKHLSLRIGEHTAISQEHLDAGRHLVNNLFLATDAPLVVLELDDFNGMLDAVLPWADLSRVQELTLVGQRCMMSSDDEDDLAGGGGGGGGAGDGAGGDIDSSNVSDGEDPVDLDRERYTDILASLHLPALKRLNLCQWPLDGVPAALADRVAITYCDEM